MTDYTRAVYDYLRSLGGVGAEVRTAIHPHLMETFELTPEKAQSARAQAMGELKSRGIVERLHTRGAYVRILAEYPDP